MGFGLWERWTRGRALTTRPPPPDDVVRKRPASEAPFDAEEAIVRARKEFALDPRGTIDRLEALRRDHPGDPLLLYGLSLLYQQAGNTPAAIGVAQEAIPLCLRRGMGLRAAELLDRIDADAAQLGIGREELIAIGGALSRTVQWRLGFRALASIVLEEPDADDAVVELLRLAERLENEHQLADEALNVLTFLSALCSGAVRAGEISTRLALLEQRMGLGAGPAAAAGGEAPAARRPGRLVLR